MWAESDDLNRVNKWKATKCITSERSQKPINSFSVDQLIHKSANPFSASGNPCMCSFHVFRSGKALQWTMFLYGLRKFSTLAGLLVLSCWYWNVLTWHRNFQRKDEPRVWMLKSFSKTWIAIPTIHFILSLQMENTLINTLFTWD